VSYATSGAKADVNVRVGSTQSFWGQPLTRQANSRDQGLVRQGYDHCSRTFLREGALTRQNSFPAEVLS
jgi:hypothetical protein